MRLGRLLFSVLVASFLAQTLSMAQVADDGDLTLSENLVWTSTILPPSPSDTAANLGLFLPG